MSEKKTITILILVLAGLGLLAFFLSFYSFQKFNFYKTDLNIQDNLVTEKLSFKPDQPYHTLFRNFVAELIVDGNSVSSDYIKIASVSCSQGTPYAKDASGLVFLMKDKPEQSQYAPYTEPNEYGCTFGNTLGFQKNTDYTVKSTYELHTNTLFKIKDKYYIKFVAYSKDMHTKLVKGKNFFVNTGITKDKFSVSENVYVYIEYNGDTNSKSIIEYSDFQFDASSSNSKYFLLLAIALFPSIFCFIVWIIGGKELTEIDLPSTLSYYPNERKAWEVASYFHPPFSVIDKDFFSSIMMSLYHMKIIDIKIKDKKAYVKLTGIVKELDRVESDFLDILKKIISSAKEKNIDGGYVDIQAASSSFFTKMEMKAYFKTLQKDVKEGGNQYLSTIAVKIVSVGLLLAIYPLFMIFGALEISPPWLIFFYFISLFSINIVNSRTALFSRYKSDFNKEYQQWQAFRSYLKQFPSMKNSPPEAVKLWDKYLVYASALGVSKQVLNKFKEWKIIDNQTFVFYTSASMSFNSFAASAAPSSGGGGGGGGGGVGGGGGGGR